MINGDPQDVLAYWFSKKDRCKWALAIIYQTEGHSYRKTGAFTLVSEQGDQLGVLSGGCLEADIRLVGQKAIALNQVICKEYDGRDDEDISYQLGCGGIVWIAFVPLTAGNNNMGLVQVYEQLEHRVPAHFALQIPLHKSEPDNVATRVAESSRAFSSDWLFATYRPKTHLLIVGGGKDAIPVCHMAKQLGWIVSVWDPRGAYGRAEEFAEADYVLDGPAEALTEMCTEQHVAFAICMAHNVDIDAKALAALATTSLSHIALLGPKVRFLDVVDAAGIHADDIIPALSGPAGLDIGGDLPSSIALSIVAKFHAIAHGKA